MIGIVQQLGKFLQYLDRSDITEIVFQSGAAAVAKKKGKLRPVTREPLSANHILKLVRATPLERLVPEHDGASPPTITRINGVNYIATVARSGPMLMLRVRREGRHTAPPEAPKVPIGSIKTSVEPMKETNGLVAEEVGLALATDGEVAPATMESGVVEQRAVATGLPVAVAAIEPSVARTRVSYRPDPEASTLGEFVRSDAAVRAPEALRVLLGRAREMSASDVHIMSGEPVRFRCEGRMIALGDPIPDAHALALVTPLLKQRDAQQLDEIGYADFACQLEGADRFRVNVNRQRTGVKACFRLIMREPPTLEALGLPHELRQMLSYHQGLVVVSGPSGAGKTTTLAALVDLFNSERAVHIITVEDPVEVIHPIKKAIVTQREVGAHTKSFHAALKGSLREDPDVIAIGELRDRETVEKALEAAETGHLVFATMSTPSAASTIDRLIDMFPPDDQSQVRATLGGVLKFVVSQRLVPRSDGKGRVVAVELLTGNMALWTLIRDDKLYQLPSLQQRGRGFGMIRIEDSLNELLRAGAITRETAKRFANDPRAIDEMQSPAGVPRDDDRDRREGRRNPFSRKGR